ncbi:HDOD domain-containing protein [Sulfurimonas sp. HSL-1716]|uniref:HDOD domain-containing protein n=1 Tax=Hydrocurvibacter sulfurireducens TaxID=3131937 RepID=UPI0031F7990D
MVTTEDIQEYIKKIPPTPEILNKTFLCVNSGDLVKAAKIAEQDLALKAYLKNLVNKPIYGFRNEISDLSQIFGILGVNAAKQSLYNYMLSLLSPKTWVLFKMNQTLFYDFQADLSRKWHDILVYLKIDDKDIESSITLLPSSIIVCEALFKTNIDNVKLLKSAKNMDYNTILKRLTNLDLFDISRHISKSWNMPDKIGEIVQAASGVKPSNNRSINTLGKWMHLLLFYELSQPRFIEAGLNDFIEFNVEYASDIYEEFMQVVNMDVKQ